MPTRCNAQAWARIHRRTLRAAVRERRVDDVVRYQFTDDDLQEASAHLRLKLPSVRAVMTHLGRVFGDDEGEAEPGEEDE